jgi:DNA-binding NarL/FixJ family response regulator
MPIGKHRCVVLADSHQDTLEGVRGLLEAIFETVMMVADKESLFEAVDRVQPGLAVVDLSLRPRADTDVARELKRRYPDLKFIILSIHDDSCAARSIIENGASGFVLKRCVGTDLFAAIDCLQEGRVFVSPAVGKTPDQPSAAEGESHER